MSEKVPGRVGFYIGEQGVKDLAAIIVWRGYNGKRDGSRVIREALAREIEAAKAGEPAVEPRKTRREGVRHG